MQMSYVSQTQSVMAVGVARSKTSLHNRGNLSSGYTILEPAIHILLIPHYEISIKTRIENAKYCQQSCQRKNRVGLD